MSFLRCAILFLCLALAGCHPGPQASGDEQKEPYFLAAKKRHQERDYPGAIDYFEKALDVNPRSASAHFELGVLYEQYQYPSDYSAALYHYQKAVNLRPDFPAGDIIRQHIEQCKRELAKSVVQLPSVENLQKKVEALTADNEKLRQALQAWQSYYAGRGVTMVSNVPVLVPSSNHAEQKVTPETPARNDSPTVSHTGSAPRAVSVVGTGRTHIVGSGDTLEKIARKYGVKLSSLQSANPSVDARRLRPNQILVIPPSSP